MCNPQNLPARSLSNVWLRWDVAHVKLLGQFKEKILVLNPNLLGEAVYDPPLYTPLFLPRRVEQLLWASNFPVYGFIFELAESPGH